MTESGTDRLPLNHLAGERSPYLRLHRHNPVDWYPWGEEALERAREEDKPIFLSVGYSTCYWCHVMERESFSDPGVAAYMNEHFVNVKVDREERPELDELYMAATQVLSGQGGWPNSLFLTPDLEPFFAGTYFPPEPAHGRPSFSQLLEAMTNAWRHRRDDVQEQAASLARAVRHYLEDRGAPAAEPPDGEAARQSLDALRQMFDGEQGGFGSAPKFPTPGNLLLLLDAVETPGPEAAEARAMLERTLDAMARGGIYDQLGGGFHRYATDREWRIPHFEKMLYDQGLLLEIYGRWFAATGDRQARRVCLETSGFLRRELTSPDGALWSALDAETEGEEGAFYAWRRDELHAALGEEDFGFAAPLLGFDGPPFFEGDRYVLHLPAPLAEQAARRRMAVDDLRTQLEPLRRRLFEVREGRPRPALDDKVLADWNGTAIRGLAVAGRALDAPELVEQAARTARAVLLAVRPDDGPLFHVWNGEAATVAAMLPDYVFLIGGLLALAEATDDESWLEAARSLRDEQEARLAHPEGGYVTAAARDDLFATSREIFDGALPSGNGQAALNDLELHRLTGESRWLEAAAKTLRTFAAIVERAPDGARVLSLAAKRHAATPAARPGGAADRPVDPEDEARTVVDSRVELGEAEADGWRPFRVTFRVADGWHVYAPPEARDPAPHGAPPGGPQEVMPVHLTPTEGVELRDLDWPPARVPEPDGPPIYEGTLEVTGRCRKRDGGNGRIALRLGYQPCDATRCLAGVTVDLAAG